MTLGCGAADVDVLIVGAGPTGLILAHELLRRGVRCRLIEKRPSPSGSTRAFTIHARTMEMFDHMGLAPNIEDLREVCPGNHIHFRGLDNGPEVKLDFTRLQGTRYNYYAKINQNDLDRALRESLAAKYSFYPEFDVEFLSTRERADGLSATIRDRASGKESVVRAGWLIGADGSNSTVRATLGASFESRDADNMTMSMVDVDLEGFLGDRAWVNYYVSEQGFMLVTGLPGGIYRLYLAGALENYLKEGTPQQAFQRGLDYFETGARITRMDWSSSWVIRKIVGEAYLAGRTVLCGDATHVHSPAGGQGMNACMQDAFNLGWKLSLAVQGRTGERVLESYVEERRPIAEQVTAGASRMQQVLFDAKTPVRDRYLLTQDPDWHDETVRRISALSHNYRGIDGATAGLTLEAHDVQPGDRAPDCDLSAEPPRRRLYDVCRHPGFTLLLMPGDDAETARARALVALTWEKFGPRVNVAVIARVPIEGLDFDRTEIDRTGAIGRLFGQPAGGQMILIRPDLYVGFRGSLSAEAALCDYLHKWVAPTTVEAGQVFPALRAA